MKTPTKARKRKSLKGFKAGDIIKFKSPIGFQLYGIVDRSYGGSLYVAASNTAAHDSAFSTTVRAKDSPVKIDVSSLPYEVKFKLEVEATRRVKTTKKYIRDLTANVAAFEKHLAITQQNFAAFLKP